MKQYSSIFQRHIPKDGEGHVWFQVLVVFAATLGAFSAGSLSAWPSPSIPLLISNTTDMGPITLDEASYLTIIPPIAAIILAPILSLLIDYVGRRKTVMVLAVSYFLSWTLIAFSKSLLMFYLARIFTGLGDVTAFMVVPVYIGEITQPKVRNTWGNFFPFFTYFGQLLINAIGSYYSITTTAHILSCVPLLQLLLMLFMPESPYFLLMKNREQEARMSLKILRWTDNVEDELKIFSEHLQLQLSEPGTLKELFFNPIHRKALFIMSGIRAAQQFCGLPIFFMYTQYMFIQAGSNLPASTSAIIFSGIFLTVITLFSFFVGRFGRRPLLTLSCFSCGFVLAIEAVYFYIHEKTRIDTSGYTWIPLAGMILYVPACSIGLAILPGLMLGELFATNVKGKAMGVLHISYSIFVLTVAKLFHLLTVNFGMYVPFCLFSVSSFVNVAFSYYCVPETKGKTLEQIQENLRGSRAKKNVHV